MTFRSKVDWWYYAIIIASAGSLGYGTYAVIETGVTSMLWFMAIISVFAVGLPVWLLFGTNYTVTEETLIVRSGPFRWRVERNSIRSLQPCRSPLSGPALSLDRVEVSYGNGQSLLISPADIPNFMKAIQE